MFLVYLRFLFCFCLFVLFFDLQDQQHQHLNLSKFTKVAVADLGWNKETFRVQYALSYTYLSKPVMDMLGHVSATGLKDSSFGLARSVLYNFAFRRSFPYPNAQVCLVSRLMKAIVKGAVTSSVAENDTVRVCVYAALTVQQL